MTEKEMLIAGINVAMTAVNVTVLLVYLRLGRRKKAKEVMERMTQKPEVKTDGGLIIQQAIASLAVVAGAIMIDKLTKKKEVK